MYFRSVRRTTLLRKKKCEENRAFRSDQFKCSTRTNELSLSHLLPIKRSNCWATRGKLKLKESEKKCLDKSCFTSIAEKQFPCSTYSITKSPSEMKINFFEDSDGISGREFLFAWGTYHTMQEHHRFDKSIPLIVSCCVLHNKLLLSI